MDNFTRDDLIDLTDRNGEALLSLYMPTERAGREVRQNRIRFKNLLDDASKLLETQSINTEQLQAQLKDLGELEENDDWWQHQSDGLAIFLDGKEFQRWRIPQEFPTICVCSDKFHVRPLCQFLQNDGRFYLLAVSQNDVRFYLSSKTSIAEVPEAGLPKDLRSALNIDEYVSSLQHHSATPTGDAMFHGHGGSDPDVKKQDEIKRYFQHINAALDSYFGVEHLPLVFAGVEYLFPIFQETCDYNRLVDKPVSGNPDELSGEQLHGKAWPLVEKLFDTQRKDLLEQYGTAVSRQLGSDDMKTVLSAARQGQVSTLLTARGEHLWANDSQTAEDQEEDLVNAAVVATLRNGGDVYSVGEDQLQRPLAGIFRYATSTKDA